jgi:hypothetical protein
VKPPSGDLFLRHDTLNSQRRAGFTRSVTPTRLPSAKLPPPARALLPPQRGPPAALPRSD